MPGPQFAVWIGFVRLPFHIRMTSCHVISSELFSFFLYNPPPPFTN